MRPLFIDQDAPTSPLFTAKNKPLGFELKTWLGAKGVVTISEQAGKVQLVASFTGLRPGDI